MKKLNEFGYTKAELLILVVLLGIVAFITISSTSYAFANNKSEGRNEIKKLVEIQAEDYGMDHLDLFEKTDTTFISVNDLVESGYMLGNEKGLITDPADKDKNYNNSKVKLEYDKENNQVIATFVD